MFLTGPLAALLIGFGAVTGFLLRGWWDVTASRWAPRRVGARWIEAERTGVFAVVRVTLPMGKLVEYEVHATRVQGFDEPVANLILLDGRKGDPFG